MSSRKTTLIRCSTEDSSGFFDSTLYEDLTIQADAEIALNSLTIESQAVDTLIINNINNVITWGVLQNETFSAVLNTGSYNIDNFGDFLQDVNFKMNGLIPFASTPDTVNNPPLKPSLNKSAYVGLQWNTSVSQKGTTTIQYQVSPVENILNNPNIVKNNLNITAGDINLADPTNEGYYFNKIETCKGFGSNYFIVDGIGLLPSDAANPGTNPNPTPTNISFGLTLLDPSSITTFDDSIIVRGLNIKSDTNIFSSEYLYYSEIDGGVESQMVDDSGNPLWAQQGDCIYVAIVNNNIKLMIGRDNRVLYEANYPIFSPALLKMWNVFLAHELPVNDRKIATKKTCYDPYVVKQVITFHDKDNEDKLGTNYPQTNNFAATFVRLEFNALDIARYLGFNNIIYGPVSSVINPVLKKYGYAFIGESKIEYFYVPEALVIELMNIDLNSYDTSKNRRKSILAVIPNYESDINSLKRFVYDVVNPKYVSIRNDKPRTLRNIQMRILDDDLVPIEINGKATISLFIR